MLSATIYLITKLVIIILIFVVTAYALVNIFGVAWWLLTAKKRKERADFIKQIKQYPRKKFNSYLE